MTAKEYLSQYKLLDTEINSKHEQVEWLRAKAMSISHTEGGGTGGNSDRIGATVAKLVDAKNEINSMIDKLLLLKAEIEKTIAAVDNPTYRQVLFLRYINCHTLEKIAEEMNYSYMQICRIHGKALQAAEKNIKNL